MSGSQSITKRKKETEYIGITLPCNAVDIVTSQIGSHANTQNMGLTVAESITESAIGRNITFPCGKKSHWNEQIELRIVHPHNSEPVIS